LPRRALALACKEALMYVLDDPTSAPILERNPMKIKHFSAIDVYNYMSFIDRRKYIRSVKHFSCRTIPNHQMQIK